MDFSVLSKLLPMEWRHALIWRRERNRNIKLVEAERRGGNAEIEFSRLSYELASVGWGLEDERAGHHTRKLRREADRLQVYFPSLPARHDLDEEDENWRVSLSRGYVLTTTGIMLVRKAIRDEEKARRERRIAWVPVLTSLVSVLTGLLGVIVVLVSVGRCGS